jgi:hypothetical protein
MVISAPSMAAFSGSDHFAFNVDDTVVVFSGLGLWKFDTANWPDL